MTLIKRSVEMAQFLLGTELSEIRIERGKRKARKIE